MHINFDCVIRMPGPKQDGLQVIWQNGKCLFIACGPENSVIARMATGCFANRIEQLDFGRVCENVHSAHYTQKHATISQSPKIIIKRLDFAI